MTNKRTNRTGLIWIVPVLFLCTFAANSEANTKVTGHPAAANTSVCPAKWRVVANLQANWITHPDRQVVLQGEAEWPEFVLSTARDIPSYCFAVFQNDRIRVFPSDSDNRSFPAKTLKMIVADAGFAEELLEADLAIQRSGSDRDLLEASVNMNFTDYGQGFDLSLAEHRNAIEKKQPFSTHKKYQNPDKPDHHAEVTVFFFPVSPAKDCTPWEILVKLHEERLQAQQNLIAGYATQLISARATASAEVTSWAPEILPALDHEQSFYANSIGQMPACGTQYDCGAALAEQYLGSAAANNLMLLLPSARSRIPTGGAGIITLETTLVRLRADLHTFLAEYQRWLQAKAQLKECRKSH